MPELLERGAQAHGFRGEVWTCERVAIVIRREFGVSYHPAHVSRLLKALEAEPAEAPAPGESAGRGGHRTLEREEVAFPQKRALKEGRTIVFADQSGFYLLPMVVRTYAPVGKTPILKENLTRDHLSAMSAITLEGKLYMTEQERAFKGEDVVRFLKHLMRQIPGKLLVIWDGSPIHRGGAVKDFLSSGALQAAATGATTRLRSGSQPRRGSLEAPQVRGVEEPLLREPRGVEGRATQGQGAPQTQERCHPRLHKAARIRGLDVCAEISKGFRMRTLQRA